MEAMADPRPHPTSRSLAEELRRWPDERLAQLLRERSDLCQPVPQDSTQLAARAASTASLTRCLDGLDVLELTTLDALREAGYATRTALLDLVAAPDQEVADALDHILTLALAWPAPRGLRALSGVGEALRVGAGPAPHPTPPGHPGPVPLEPALATSREDPERVDRIGAAAAFDVVRRVELALDAWGQRPPGVLRGGGLGVRDLRTLARDLHLDEPTATLLVEVAHEAGLLAEETTASGAVVWMPTGAFDTWLGGSIAERWYTLANAWLHSAWIPAATGATGPSARNALAPHPASPLVPDTRQHTLSVLAQTAPGEVLAAGTGIASVVARARWQRPRRPEAADELVVAAIREATTLGVLGGGGITTAGRALVAQDSALVTRSIAPHLPRPVDHVLLQGDLTAVAPGPLEAHLASTLHLLADVESRGGATVYRFTAGSLRRAYEAGWSAVEVHDALAAASRTAVPQALSYLVDDVARTFGTLRVGEAAGFVRSDDEAALGALVSDPRAAPLGLRLLAPTVAISALPATQLLSRLRELGGSPVLEAPDGTVRVTRPAALRTSRRGQARAPAASIARVDVGVAAALRAVRAGDRVLAEHPRPLRSTTPAGALALLREAIETGATVSISYLDQHGDSTQHLIRPARLDGGRLTGYDDLTRTERTFAVQRIGVVAMTGPGGRRPTPGSAT